MRLSLNHRLRALLQRSDGQPRLKMGESLRVSSPWVELRVDPTKTEIEEALSWCRSQTLSELHVVGVGSAGSEVWRIDPQGRSAPPPSPARYFLSARTPPEIHSSWIETAVLTACVENLDAVQLAPGLTDPPLDTDSPRHLFASPDSVYTLFAAKSFKGDPVSGVSPKRRSWVGKKLPLVASESPPEASQPYIRTPQVWKRSFTILIDGLSQSKRIPAPATDLREPLLVTTPFLARGGAEHTLFETLRAIKDRFEITLVTLAPHRGELGDRRLDFLEVTPRILCLGDIMHPAAMPGVLRSLLDSTQAKTLYNANGTTLFYDFAPQLKESHPEVTLVDHLYDHEIGYIDRYQEPALLDSVDLCVAENHQIAATLQKEFSWPESRVPVIWPCGRNATEIPAPSTVSRVRAEVREELEFEPDDVVFLTAARMHDQKRPLDLVRLAERVRDLNKVHFLVVGGGPLEQEVDAAIQASEGIRLRRLPFRGDIPRLLVASDVGCLVSEYEGLPVFMMESFQMGRPFLGTDVGDLGRVIRSTGAGIVVESPGDLDALEQAVRSLAKRENRSKLEPLARAAAEQFSVAACAERYARVFVGRGQGATDLSPDSP